jgi:choline-sulfatase
MDPARPLRVSILTLILSALLVAACSEPDPWTRPSVLLITVDTLRADHIGTYAPSVVGQAPDASRTPHFDALAAAGVVYLNAAAPMPLTRPSHFSILTSRYPREHGVMNNAIALPEVATTLPEIFAENGYRTGGFVSVALLDEASGAAQGFEAFTYPSDPRERPAEAAVREMLSWLEALPAHEPFFAWVHLFDPHLPYGPPAAHRAGLDDALAERWPELGWLQLYAIARKNDGEVPAAVYDHARALYHGEVEYTDSQVGTLLDGLSRLDRRDNTIVVLTADHGESFENGVYFEHADSLFDGSLRIPLIIAQPGASGAWPIPGTRVEQQVSSIDIAPTLLAAAGIVAPEGYSGKALQQASQFGDRYVLVQRPFYEQKRAQERQKLHSEIETVAGKPVSRVLVDRERVGLVGTDWKLLRTDDVSSLYHRAADPHETHDVAEQEAEVRLGLERALERELEAHPLQVIDPGEIDGELVETLKALGYVQ